MKIVLDHFIYIEVVFHKRAELVHFHNILCIKFNFWPKSENICDL